MFSIPSAKHSHAAQVIQQPLTGLAANRRIAEINELLLPLDEQMVNLANKEAAEHARLSEQQLIAASIYKKACDQVDAEDASVRQKFELERRTLRTKIDAIRREANSIISQRELENDPLAIPVRWNLTAPVLAPQLPQVLLNEDAPILRA